MKTDSKKLGKRCIFKEWVRRVDVDLEAITTPSKCRISLDDIRPGFTDEDTSLIYWSSSDDENNKSSDHLSQQISSQETSTQENRAVSISSFSSELCSQQFVTGSTGTNREVEDDIEEIPLSECPISKRQREFLVDPIHPDFGDDVTPKSMFCKDSQESETEICSQSSPKPEETTGPQGTTWLQGISWQPKTPEKMPVNTELELGSGKKKCLRGGFADQLKRLEARRRSSQTIWRHERHSGISNQLVLQVEKIISHKGLTKALCRVLPSNHVLGQEHLQNHETLSKKEESFERCILLLSSVGDASSCDVTANCIVNIYPPWQKLKLTTNDEPLILCPRFMEIIQTEGQNETADSRTEEMDFVYYWECPCRNGVCPADLCPLQSTKPDASYVTIGPTCSNALCSI